MTNNREDAFSLAASMCTTSAADMSPSLANHLYENGAFIVGDVEFHYNMNNTVRASVIQDIFIASLLGGPNGCFEKNFDA